MASGGCSLTDSQKLPANMCVKGSKVYVEGAVRTRQWEQDGVKRYSTEIVASQMQMLDSRQGNSQGGGQIRVVMHPSKVAKLRSRTSISKRHKLAPNSHNLISNNHHQISSSLNSSRNSKQVALMMVLMTTYLFNKQFRP